ncbi:MAG: DUF5615 family PIN-like protein [Patescibacteria group bacterium]
MKFVADINIAQKVIKLLRKTGHNLVDIKKLNLTIPDVDIIKLASDEHRIILTHDKDFLGLSKFPKYQVGMIVIRLSVQNAEHHYLKLKEVLEKYSESVLLKSLTILKEDSIEIFKYPKE